MEGLGTTTLQKSCAKWRHMFSLDLCIIFWGSVTSNHHPIAPKQLKSRWICQNRAGSSRIPRGKTLKKIMSSKSIHELHSSQKIIKKRTTELGERWSQNPSVYWGGPLSRLQTAYTNFVWQLT